MEYLGKPLRMAMCVCVWQIVKYFSSNEDALGVLTDQGSVS